MHTYGEKQWRADKYGQIIKSSSIKKKKEATYVTFKNVSLTSEVI